MENIVICKFGVESEAYQPFSDLKTDPHNHSCDIRQAVLVRLELGTFRMIDEFNDGRYVNDTFTGGLLGAFIGILGGPIGAWAADRIPGRFRQGCHGLRQGCVHDRERDQRYEG